MASYAFPGKISISKKQLVVREWDEACQRDENFRCFQARMQIAYARHNLHKKLNSLSNLHCIHQSLLSS